MSKVIVITGGGEGLGRAFALRFAGDGHKLVLLGRTKAKLEAVAKEIGKDVVCVACDVGSPESVKTAFAEIAKHHPKIDVLLNNAGIYGPAIFPNVTDEWIQRSIATNLTGPILCIREAIPLLPRGGHIINISSESAGMLFPHLSIYQATKAGMERFSQAMEHELEPLGIRVTVVRAGSMMDPERLPSPGGDMAAWKTFHEACVAAGLDLTKRPISTFKSSVEIVRAIINLPPDVHIQVAHQRPWRP